MHMDIDVIYSIGSNIVAVVIIAVLVAANITLAVIILVIICKRCKSGKYDHVHVVNGWL